MKRRKTAKERLRLQLERAREPHLLKLLPKSDFGDPQVREKIANLALRLTDHPRDAALKTAFEKFELDPDDPFHWADLLRVLVEIVFEVPVRKRRGAKPKWDEHRRSLFQTHVAMARRNVAALFRRHGHPPPTDEDIADYLRWKWPEYYRAIWPATLRRYIVSGHLGRTGEK
jgi:hypothetical protein